MIIDQDQIKIRPRQHFPPAELAQSDYGKLPALHHAMPRGKFSRHMRQQRRNRSICQRAACLARRIGVYGAFKGCRINVEFAFLDQAAGSFHRFFEIARFLQQSRQGRGSAANAAARAHQQPFKRCRVMRQMIRQLRRRPQNAGQAFQHGWVAMQKAQDLHASGQPPKQRIKAHQRRIRVPLLGEGRQQAWHQRRQQFACAFTANGARMAVMPAAHTGGDAAGIGVAHGTQRRDGRGVILHAGENQIALHRIGGECWFGFKHAPVMLFHTAQMMREILGKTGAIGVAQEGCDARYPFRIFRQAMRLPIGHHLQPMFQAAQEAISIGQVSSSAAFYLARTSECGKRAKRGRISQSGIAPAPDQLQHLRGEFDFANAAPAKLHIMPGQLHRIMGTLRPLMGVDLPLDGMNIGNRCEIQITPPNKGPDFAQECLARRAIRRDWPRLDHGRAFPILAHAFIIGDGSGDGDSKRCRRWIRPQAQIGAKHIAIGGAFFHQPHQITRDTHINRLGAIRVLRRCRIIKHHQIHIG